MSIIKQDRLITSAKYSLAFLWIFTGLTSTFISPDIGYEILSNAKVTGSLADTAVYAGGMLDIILGLWLMTSFKTKLCCIVQVTVIALYTLLLTLVDASFWLHPFGPITKNIPIIVLIAYVYTSDATRVSTIATKSTTTKNLN
ncbi:DoxX-like family protein [Colwellia psychrerythraea]|uniref:DoxX family n=1 Tax=Colwellia psychrerythraea TaxID=28229 RepID=A0A099L4V0_COLPS|nr:DoxX-like family protein [Colwellia psychrerythraea]KGJ96913.1 DoxX family [Colwellia psychrerythraea]